MRATITTLSSSAWGLLRSVASLGVASLAVKPLWLGFITVACARVLGAEGYGMFNTATALAAIAFSFTSWGIQPYTVREVSADRASAGMYLSNFVTMRLALGVLAAIGAIVASRLLGHSLPLTLAVGIACVYSAASGLATYSHAFFQAFGVLRYQAWAVAAEKVLVILAGGAFLYFSASAVGTLAGMAMGAALTAAVALRFVARKLAPVRRKDVSVPFLRRAVPSLLPLGVGSILGVAFFRIDTVMVEAFLGEAAAGHYGLAFRIVEALNLLPALLVGAAAYPRLSSLVSEGRETEARRLTVSTAALLLVASVPVAALLSVFSGPVIGVAGGADLAPAAPALAVLAWAFPLTSVRHLLWLTLLARGEDTYTMWALAGGVALNTALNAALLPSLGVQGAVIATLVSEAVLLLTYGARLAASRAA